LTLPVSFGPLPWLPLHALSTRGPGAAAGFFPRYHEDLMKWEYIVREFSVQDTIKVLLLEEFLNEVGKDGWELVSVAATPTESFTHLVYLKRASSVAGIVSAEPPL